jgi:sugar-specific transcriptional regulator TrmB
MDIVECLMQIGFTKHEAVLYITLCREGELTGYEAAKISGIPRSNAYLALAGLVEKGGAFRIDSDAVKYTAVPAAELIYNVRRKTEKMFELIEENVPLREKPGEPYITISGRQHIIDKMSHIISHAAERVYLSASPVEVEFVKRELLEARDRGLKVVLITSGPSEIEGITVYRNEKQPGQIRLIVDTSHVLTGELAADDGCTCLYSMNKNLIQLIKDSLTNEIKLIQLKNR